MLAFSHSSGEMLQHQSTAGGNRCLLGTAYAFAPCQATASNHDTVLSVKMIHKTKIISKTKTKTALWS